MLRNTALWQTIVVASLLCAPPLAKTATGSKLINISIEQMVRTSSTILVGKVSDVAIMRGKCSLSMTVRFKTVRALKGSSRGGVYQRYYAVANPGCPSVSAIVAPCTVAFHHGRVGQQAVFFAGGQHGDGCSARAAIPKIKKILNSRLTVKTLINKLPQCHSSNCYYIVELGSRGAKAVGAIKRAIVTKQIGGGRQQLLFWALGRIKSRATCRVLRRFLRRPATVVPQTYNLEAIGNAGCRSLLPHVRKLFVKADPKGYLPYVLLRIFATLRDRRAVPLLSARLSKPAWKSKLLTLVLTLGNIGDRRAIAPLCARLAAGQFSQPVEATAIKDTVKKLGGQCRHP